MSDKLYWLPTESEHGNTKARLRRAAADYLGKDQNAPEFEIIRDDKGRPVIKGFNISCSVSHSGGIWLCAISAAPVGVDIQCRQNCRTQQLARRFFHPEEAAWLAQRGDDSFFEVWCAKESYLKYTGEGLAGGLDSFSVVADGKLVDSINGAPLRRVSLLPDCFVCLCGGTTGQLTVMQMPDE